MNKKVKILWNDAFFYTTHDVVPESVSLMETTGILEEDGASHMIIREPKTINTKSREEHPKNGKPSFYFIPKEMIVSIEFINNSTD